MPFLYKLVIRLCQPQSSLSCLWTIPASRLTLHIAFLLLFQYLMKVLVLLAGLMSHKQGDAVLYDARGKFDHLLKVNSASELLTDIQGMIV